MHVLSILTLSEMLEDVWTKTNRSVQNRSYHLVTENKPQTERRWVPESSVIASQCPSKSYSSAYPQAHVQSLQIDSPRVDNPTKPGQGLHSRGMIIGGVTAPAWRTESTSPGRSPRRLVVPISDLSVVNSL